MPIYWGDVMKNKEAKQEMIYEYGRICFLGGTISKKNPLTIHHLKPVRAGGKTILINLALLGNLQHQAFNIIENNNKKQAEELNDGFREFKNKRYKLD